MKLLKTSTLVFLLAVLVAACTSKPKGDEAEVSEAKEVTEPATGTTLAVVKDNSKMEWVGTKPGGRHYGSIAIEDGNVVVKEGEITGGTFTFNINEIEVEDLKADTAMHAKLVGHLQSPDFFDAANHPKATFEIVSVEPLASEGETASAYNSMMEDMEQPAEGERIMEAEQYELEGATHKVTGNLTMRGKTLAITVPAKVTMEDGKVNAFTKFTIDRTKWGLMYGDESNAVDKAKDKFIFNSVGVGFDVTASASTM